MKEKFIIYQLLPRLFGNTNSNCVPNSSIDTNGCGKFNDINELVLDSIKDLGCTHIWYTGVIEHSTTTDYTNFGILKDNNCIVKGKAGSPYAIKDYYDVDPDLSVDVANRMKEFEALINRTHKAGLKIIIDFVPNHLARSYKSDVKPNTVKDFGDRDKTDYFFHPMNNFYYVSGDLKLPIDNNDFKENPAKATGNNYFGLTPVASDWYDTVKLNYGVDYAGNTCFFDPIPDTWFKMAEILEFWALKGIDGFRCDMAEMIPVEFWHWVIERTKSKKPNTLFIAEIYQKDLYPRYIDHGNFDYLYDKVGLYDNLRAILRNESPAYTITDSWQAIDGIQNRMLNFLENHDEQRVASEFFLGDPYRVIPALSISLFLNKAPFMLYFGQELGEKGMDIEGYSSLDGKTSIFDYWSVSSVRNWLLDTDSNLRIRNIYKCLLTLSLKELSFRKGETYDLQYVNLSSEYFNSYYQYAFIRYYKSELILVVANFEEKEKSLQVNIPKHAFCHFKIQDKKVFGGIDLLTGQSIIQELSPNTPFKVNVKEYNVSIIKFNIE